MYICGEGLLPVVNINKQNAYRVMGGFNASHKFVLQGLQEVLMSGSFHPQFGWLADSNVEVEQANALGTSTTSLW